MQIAGVGPRTEVWAGDIASQELSAGTWYRNSPGGASPSVQEERKGLAPQRRALGSSSWRPLWPLRRMSCDLLWSYFHGCPIPGGRPIIWLWALCPCSNIANRWWSEACGPRFAAGGVPELLWLTLGGERGGAPRRQ